MSGNETRQGWGRESGLPAVLGVCLAAAFLAWTLVTATQGLRSMDTGLAAYAKFAVLAIVVGLIAAFAMRRAPRGRGLLATMGIAALPAYAAALKAAGWLAAPWLALGAVAACAVVVGRRALAPPPALVLLVHVQATLVSLYLLFRLDDFLAGWPDTLAAAKAAATLLARMLPGGS